MYFRKFVECADPVLAGMVGMLEGQWFAGSVCLFSVDCYREISDAEIEKRSNLR